MKDSQSESVTGDVLIVDDLPDNVYLLSTILSGQGYGVRKALNGKQALTTVYNTPPDLILLDIMMPGINGFEVCERLKSDPETSGIPIIFISAKGEAFDKVRAFQMGASDYITKPFQVEEVLARVTHQLSLLRQQKQLQEQNQILKRLVTQDSLTGLANRRRFDECLQIEWQRMAREKTWLSLMMCDVDFFKSYNDTYGHQAGDVCLHQVAQALQNCIKRPGDVVARYGGEEFAVILPHTQLDGAVRVAEAIQREVKALKIVHFKPNTEMNPQLRHNSYVTLSLGIASIVPNRRSSPEQLIQAADDALYDAKASGRDTYRFQCLYNPY